MMKEFIRVRDYIIAVDDIHTITIKKSTIEYEFFNGRSMEYFTTPTIVINGDYEILFENEEEMQNAFDLITGRLNAYIMPNGNIANNQ